MPRCGPLRWTVTMPAPVIHLDPNFIGLNKFLHVDYTPTRGTTSTLAKLYPLNFVPSKVGLFSLFKLTHQSNWNDGSIKDCEQSISHKVYSDVPHSKTFLLVHIHYNLDTILPALVANITAFTIYRQRHNKELCIFKGVHKQEQENK